MAIFLIAYKISQRYMVGFFSMCGPCQVDNSPHHSTLKVPKKVQTQLGPQHTDFPAMPKMCVPQEKDKLLVFRIMTKTPLTFLLGCEPSHDALHVAQFHIYC